MTLVNFSLLFFLMIFLLLIEYFIKVNNRLLVFFLILGFSFFTANRGINTADTTAYATFFENIGTSFNVLSVPSSFEPGYVFVNVLFNNIFGNNFRIFFFFLTFICMSIIWNNLNALGIEKKVLPLIIYISFFGIYFHGAILRAGVAFTMLLSSWVNIKEKKIKSIFFFFLALCFHRSAIFSLPIYLLSLMVNRKVNINLKDIKLTNIMWLFLIFIIYIMRPEIIIFRGIEFANDLGLFQNSYGYYIENIKLTSGISIRFLFNLFVGFILIQFGDLKNKYYQLSLNIYLVGLTILSLFSAFLWVERVTDFYLAISFLLIAAAMKNNNQRALNIILTAIYVGINLFFVYRIVA